MEYELRFNKVLQWHIVSKYGETVVIGMSQDMARFMLEMIINGETNEIQI